MSRFNPSPKGITKKITVRVLVCSHCHLELEAHDSATSVRSLGCRGTVGLLMNQSWSSPYWSKKTIRVNAAASYADMPWPNPSPELLESYRSGWPLLSFARLPGEPTTPANPMSGVYRITGPHYMVARFDQRPGSLIHCMA